MKKLICLLITFLLVISSVGFAFADEASPMRIGENNQLSVPLYMQQKTFTCGPACLRMTLKKLGITVSEATLEAKAGTTSGSGTYVYMMRNTLNYYTGNKYEYYKTANSDFQSKVISDIKKGYPIICHVAPSVLPNYKNQQAPAGHYVVVKGYIIQAGATANMSVTYNDPHYNPDIHGTWNAPLKTMITAINNNADYYIAYNGG